MAGLDMTAESLQGNIRALLEERHAVETKLAAAEVDEDEKAASRYRGRLDLIAQQLRVRGAEAETPHQRAAKRRTTAETRA